MANITHGMNPDEVDRLGRELQRIAGEIDQMLNTLNTRVGQTTWVGPDADTFKNQWWPGHRSKLHQIREDLRGFGQSAINNASEQRQVSGR